MYTRFHVLLAAVLLLALATGCSLGQQAQPTPVVTAAPVEDSPRSSGSGGASASGSIVPAREVRLGFALPGQVRGIHIREDERVEAGQVLVVLETAGLEAQLAQAEAAVAAARAGLARLTAGARPEEVASAQDAVDLAQVQVAQALAALEAAEAQFASAQAAVEAAEARLHAAQAQHHRVLAGASDAERAAVEAELKLAEAQLRQAQAAYDRVKSAPDILMRPEALALEQATIACQAAQARYNVLSRGARPEDIEAALAQVESAQVAVAQAENQALAAEALMRQASLAVEAAKVQQVQAERQVSLLRSGATEEEIDVAEAQVDQAEAALQAAQAALAQATLVAPFSGTVTDLDTGPGETVVPGQMVLALADLSALQAETTDLSERDVTRVMLKQPVSVYVEALGEQIEGQVVGIAPQATTIGGDVVYAVRIQLYEQPPRLRWGMSVEVDIETSQRGGGFESTGD